METDLELNGCPEKLLCPERRFFSYYFAFVVQLSFANVCTVAGMDFSGCSISGQCGRGCFVVRSALGTSLLTMSAFRIWHNSIIKTFNLNL